MTAPNHDMNGPDDEKGSTFRGDPDPMADPGTPGAADTGLELSPEDEDLCPGVDDEDDTAGFDEDEDGDEDDEDE